MALLDVGRRLASTSSSYSGNSNRSKQQQRQGIPRPTIHDLPPEILCRIMYFCLPTTLRGSLQPLRSASLVCRSWRDPAQRALHGHLSLNNVSGEDMDKWTSAMLAWSRNGEGEDDVPRKIDRERYPVQSLQLSFESGEELRTVMCLELAFGVKSLVLQEHFSEEVKEAPGMMDWGVLRRPSLAHLESLSIFYPEHFRDPSNVSPLPLRLKDLFLWLAFQRTTSHHLPSALFQGSQTTLTSLRLWLSDQGSSLSLHESFNLISDNLTHLSILFFKMDNTVLPLLGHLNNLKSMTYDVPEVQFPKEVQNENSLVHLLTCVTALPKRVRLSHLVLGVPERLEWPGLVKVEPLVRCLREAEQVRGLRELRFPNCRKREMGLLAGRVWEGWEDVVSACEEGGVRLVSLEDLL
ncbi:hypothetical protein T439DRAFT_380350 [Meredithblackwellia eburnea MCA 4105]